MRFFALWNFRDDFNVMAASAESRRDGIVELGRRARLVGLIMSAHLLFMMLMIWSQDLIAVVFGLMVAGLLAVAVRLHGDSRALQVLQIMHGEKETPTK
ncbi:MAG: hypothetical protein WD066_02365 [Planctomycetaceae bacterium]